MKNMIEKLTNEINQRWGSWDNYEAVTIAFRSTENLYNTITPRDIKAFGDSLKEQGYQITLISSNTLPVRTSIEKLSDAISQKVIEQLKAETPVENKIN